MNLVRLRLFFWKHWWRQMNVTFCGSDKCKHMMGLSCKINENWPYEIILHAYKILSWYHMFQVHRPHITNFNLVIFKSTRTWGSHCGLSQSSHIHRIHVIHIWFFRINFTEITKSYVWVAATDEWLFLLRNRRYMFTQFNYNDATIL